MPTQNVNLSDKQAQFIRESVNQGEFQNASEVVRAGLRLLRQQGEAEKLKLKILRQLAKSTFREMDRGEYETLGPGGLDEFMDKVDARARSAKSR
jgi:antitoxin ParD1/3/4